jgi:hypothetical protein
MSQTTPGGEKLHIHCPHCKRRFNVSSKLMGKSGPCPNCHHTFTLTSECVERTTESKPGAPAEHSKPRRRSAAPPLTVAVWFANSSDVYCLGLPTTGWLRLPPEQEAALGTEMALNHPDIGVIKIGVSPCPTTLDDLAAGLERTWAGEVAHFFLLRKGQGKIAGQPSRYVEFSGRVEGARVKFSAHVLLQDGAAYQIVGYAEPVRFPRLKKELLVALRTFSFDPARIARAAQAQPTERSVITPAQTKAAADAARNRVLKIGRQRSPRFLNSAASAARDLREHLGKDLGGLRFDEVVARWWVLISVCLFSIGYLWGRKGGGLVPLGLVFLAFVPPVAAYTWIPASLAKTFRSHLRKELGGRCVPDPDVSAEELPARLGNNPLGPLQEALNRHWAYHQRQAAALGQPSEVIRHAGPLKDVLLPLGLAVLAGWSFYQIGRLWK